MPLSGPPVAECDRMTVLNVYRTSSVKALLPMLEAWAAGLQVDLNGALRELEQSTSSARVPPSPLPTRALSSSQPLEGLNASSILRPYLQKFFTEAFISIASVYHEGKASILGNGNWCECMHTRQQLHDKLHVEGQLPEAIFARWAPVTVLPGYSCKFHYCT
jgi:hypothetical protein